MLRRDIEPGGAQLHATRSSPVSPQSPDVVEHGLFLNGIDTIVIARGDTMEVRRRGNLGLADLHLRGLDDSADAE